MREPELDRLLAEGDEQAFEVLYDRYARQLYRAAWVILGRREDAEDAVQEVFAATVRCRHQLPGVRDLKAYLFACLRHAAGRIGQRRSREPMAVDAVDKMADSTLSTGDLGYGERLHRALAALPVEQREVISLKIDGELTFDEIAKVLDVNPHTVASRYRYALEKLRRSLHIQDASNIERSGHAGTNPGK
jgi:RNA polymerase sigma-70 factor (ECF subfamily)